MNLTINPVSQPSFTAVRYKRGAKKFLKSLEEQQRKELKRDIEYFSYSKYVDLLIGKNELSIVQKNGKNTKTYSKIDKVDFPEPGDFEYISFGVVNKRTNKHDRDFVFPSNFYTVIDASKRINEKHQISLKSSLARQIEYWSDLSGGVI